VIVSVCAIAAGAAATCPAPAAALLGILEAMVVGVLLKAPQRQAVAIVLLAALAFVPLRLAAAVVADPGTALEGLSGGLSGYLFSPAVLDEAAWASALLGAGALLAAAAVTLWCREALEALDLLEPAAARRPAAAGAQLIGRARADWMLAEARRGNRLVTLGLVGVDAPAEYELEPGEREWVMGQLDEVLEDALGDDQAVSEHGPWERLLVLPDVWAEDFRDQAAALVKSARQHLRRQVRVALITFPLDGPGAAEPLDYLERALEVCRAGRSSVSVGRPRVRRMTPSHEIA
jgi:hypothetical protein